MPEAIKYYVIGFVIAFLLLGLFIILLGLLYSKKQVKNKMEREKMRAEFHQSLLQSQLEIQEQTFEHISKEIHDNLGQVASVIKINLNTLDLDERQKADEKIAASKELVKQLILDLKLLSLNLSSDRIAQMGLLRLLQTDVDRISKSGIFSINLQQQGAPYRLETDKETILYRMGQEVLNNMVKHSKAANVLVTMKFNEKSFILDFIDDGIGFNAGEILKDGLQRGSNGLHNLQKRSALINATLTVKSTPGKGTNISIELPF
jgi:signal transduction histidine kinase